MQFSSFRKSVPRIPSKPFIGVGVTKNLKVDSFWVPLKISKLQVPSRGRVSPVTPLTFLVVFCNVTFSLKAEFDNNEIAEPVSIRKIIGPVSIVWRIILGRPSVAGPSFSFL